MIICVLVLMNGIVSYAASATVALYADQASASSASITVTNNDITVWGSVSSGSTYSVRFSVPDGSRYAVQKIYNPGDAISATVYGVYYVSSTYLTLEANPNGSPKKNCIASGGIAD